MTLRFVLFLFSVFHNFTHITKCNLEYLLSSPLKINFEHKNEEENNCTRLIENMPHHMRVVFSFSLFQNIANVVFYTFKSVVL